MIDFGTDKAGQDWVVINDGVMGGLSEGDVEFRENSVLFSGAVSLENNGGFSSFKSPFQPFDLSGFDTLEVRYQSRGYPISFTLETERQFYKPYFKKGLPSVEKGWQTVRLALDQFQAYRIGYPMNAYLNSATKERIIRIGFITDAKKAESFGIEVDYISFK